MTRGWFRRDGTHDDKWEGWPKAAVKRPLGRLCEEPRHDCWGRSSPRSTNPLATDVAFPHPADARRAETLVDESPYRGPTGGTVRHHQVTHVVRNAPRVRHETIDAGGDCLDCLCDPALTAAADTLCVDDQPSVAEKSPAAPTGTPGDMNALWSPHRGRVSHVLSCPTRGFGVYAGQRRDTVAHIGSRNHGNGVSSP